jgi:glycosyltransferase involved in cell wall biosynthesis
MRASAAAPPGPDMPAPDPAGPLAATLAQGCIVHVSADYPDSFAPAKTHAIESLIRLVDDRFDNRIISLNRRAPGALIVPAVLRHPVHPQLAIAAGDACGAVVPVRYDAPGKGVYHHALLCRLGDWLANRLAARPRPALLVGHKLSVEGLAVARAAQLLGVPYALAIQGNTDRRILAARPDLRRAFARTFHGAAMVFHCAPWALRMVEAQLGERRGPVALVPYPVDRDAITPPREGGEGLLTIFHLRGYQLKNLARMAQASSLAARAVPGTRLAVVGGGTAGQVARCQAIAAGHPCAIEGPLPLDQIPARLNRARGFVLASLRESFGLVFIEALFAGVPIAYPADWAVDGHFDDARFALRVNNRNTGEIAEAMARLMRDEAAMKRALAQWQQSGAAGIFKRKAIGDAFAAGLATAMASHAEAR